MSNGPHSKAVNYPRHTKTTCFGLQNMPHCNVMDAPSETKTTCFGLAIVSNSFSAERPLRCNGHFTVT